MVNVYLRIVTPEDNLPKSCFLSIQIMHLISIKLRVHVEPKRIPLKPARATRKHPSQKHQIFYIPYIRYSL